jgi:hypothetical protein
MADVESVANLFIGRWVGETQGCAMSAHIWEIGKRGKNLVLTTRWEGKTIVSQFQAKIIPGEFAIKIERGRTAKAILLDKQHFVIPGWCTNDTRSGVGPSYDVVFSRPGIAELTAATVYARYLETGREEGSPTNLTTSPKGN